MTHFEDLTVFALLVAIAFSFLSKRTPLEWLKYALWTFLAFLLVAIAIGWLIYPFSR